MFMNRLNRKLRGFSLAEILMVATLVSIFVVISMPLLSVRKKLEGYDLSTVICIKSELASNLNTPACLSAINYIKYNQNNAYDTANYFIGQSGNITLQDATRKVLREVCDRGGKEACRFFALSCNGNNTTCDFTSGNSINYDLHYYLNLPMSNSNIGSIPIQDLVSDFYSYGYANIINEVDNTCCNPNYNLACTTCGVSSCPWQKRFASGSNKDCPYKVISDPGGNIYISGEAQYAGIQIVKMNSS